MRKIFITLALFIVSLALFSSATNYFSSIYQNFFEGRPSGIIVFKDGSFSISTDFGEGISIPSTPICSFAYNSAIFVGTTSESSVLKIENGKVEKIAVFEEPMVTAISGTKDKIYAGTSSPARLYELKFNGEKKLLSDLNTDLINSILVSGNGDLIAATGKPAKVFLISPSGETKKTISLPADHSRTLLFFNGFYYLGTANPPSLYKFDNEFNPVLVSNFDGEEITSISQISNNICLSVNSKKEKENAKIFSFSENSGISTIDTFETLINSLWSNGKEIFMGGNNGSLYFFNGTKIGLCKRFDKAISNLCGNGNSPQIIFASPPSISSPMRGGVPSYNSPIIDCSGMSKIGSIQFEQSPFYKIFIRGGNTAVPDPFWTKWFSSDKADSIDSSRYYQWRIEFSDKPEIFKGITISAKLLNRAPKIESVKVHPPGEIFVKNVSQLGDRLVQDIHDKERAFPEIAQSRPYEQGSQTYYLYGFRTISFSVSDPDNDDVRVKIEIKPSDSKTPFVLAENVKENFFTFDARTLPDGVYSLFLTASDLVSNGEAEAKNDTYEVPLFEIDNTPPQISITEDKNGNLKFFVKDNSSVRSGRFSRNGELWVTVESDEKKFGSKEATFSIKLKNDDRWIVFQAVDSFGNMSNCSWIKKD